MAYDTYKINVGIMVRLPDYEFTSKDQYDEHLHNNKELKRAVYAAVLEHISNTMPVVIVDGEEFPIESIGEMFDQYGQATTVHLNDEEQALFDRQMDAEESAWDLFSAEVDRRMSEDPDAFMLGVYSMGDLSGPISQLDEIAHEGFAQVVISGGWGDEGPVMSTSAILNPTNWDMFRMFCQALAKSNDRHHVFLEGVELDRVDADDVAIYRAITGS
jgi:hypothetical protein